MSSDHPYGGKDYGYDQAPPQQPPPPPYAAGPTPQPMATPMMNMANTTVIQQQPAVSTNTVILQSPIRPASYIGLAIFTCLCCNPLFGLIAIVFSIMSSSEADSGNFETARSQGKVSMWVSIAGMFIGIALGIFLIVYFVVIVKNTEDCLYLNDC